MVTERKKKIVTKDTQDYYWGKFKTLLQSLQTTCLISVFFDDLNAGSYLSKFNLWEFWGKWISDDKSRANFYLHFLSTKGQCRFWITLSFWPGLFSFKEYEPAKSTRTVYWLQILRGFYNCSQWAGEETDVLTETITGWHVFVTHNLSMTTQYPWVSTPQESFFFTTQTYLGTKPDIPIPRGYCTHKGWFNICLEQVSISILYTLMKL